MLAMDPGKQYFAWSVVSGNEVLGSGMLLNPVDTFSEDELYGKTMLFSNEFVKLVSRFPQITDVVAERFMVRSTMMGANCEYISYMLGYAFSVCTARGIRLHLVMPSTWKTYVARTFGLDTKLGLPEVFGFTGLSKNFVGIPVMEHQFDSFGIAVWSLSKLYGLDPWRLRRMAFDWLDSAWESGRPDDNVHIKSWLKVSREAPPAENPNPPPAKKPRRSATKPRAVTPVDEAFDLPF